MKQQIVVCAENGAKLGTTFPRRAKQLVAGSKAAWLDETRTGICLTSSNLKEENKLELTDVSNRTNDGFKIVDKTGPDALLDDKNLIALAHEKVTQKKRFKRHAVIYVVYCCFFAAFAAPAFRGWYVPGGFWGLFILLWIWSVIMLIHTVSFFTPYLKFSTPLIWVEFRTFLARYKQKKIDAEFHKLKSLSPDKLARAYSRFKKLPE